MKQELVETDFEDDDLEDAITSADDAELCPTPVSPTDAFLKVQIREKLRGSAIDLSLEDSSQHLAATIGDFETRHVTQELLLASHGLAVSRKRTHGIEPKAKRVQDFVSKIRPFDLTHSEPLIAKLDESKRLRLDASLLHGMRTFDPSIEILYQNVQNLEQTLQEGEKQYNLIHKELETIKKERAVKDQRYRKKLAGILDVPVNAVEGIIQACSE